MIDLNQYCSASVTDKLLPEENIILVCHNQKQWSKPVFFPPYLPLIEIQNGVSNLNEVSQRKQQIKISAEELKKIRFTHSSRDASPS